jgi:hypothetical protein
MRPRLLDIGDLGSRIYPKGQGRRVPARPDFGLPPTTVAALPAAQINLEQVLAGSAELL